MVKHILLSLPLLVLADQAAAELAFCNQTDATASVAIGYKGKKGWTSEGWWNLAPDECKTVVSGDLSLSHYYWHADADGLTWPHENYFFCTSSEEFTIVGDDNCPDRGYQQTAFNEIELAGRTSFTMNLTQGSGETEVTAASPAPAPEQAPDGMAPPGTHGEPYSVSGLLSHCDFYDAGMGCTFIANGWSYVASSYGPTPLSTLEALDALGPNVAMGISGDMISYSGTEAIVTIRDYERTAPDQYQAMRAAMQGLWTSVEDPKSQILIHGSLHERIYDGMPGDLGLMHFSEGCPGAPGDGPAFQLIDRLGEEKLCYFPTKDANNELSLFMPGGMRLLHYKRNQVSNH
ncbi:MAG: DUF1036 domain-containing protein [Wenzhouxiangella sp.]|jgi:uncharacterized membrane protein|nr:DUF1036 domain-containing protein [Wenzhouxiangella sp.]